MSSSVPQEQILIRYVHAQSDFEFTLNTLFYFYEIGKVPQLRINNKGPSNGFLKVKGVSF